MLTRNKKIRKMTISDKNSLALGARFLVFSLAVFGTPVAGHNFLRCSIRFCCRVNYKCVRLSYTESYHTYYFEVVDFLYL